MLFRSHVCATRESGGSSRAFGACSRRRRRPFICPGVRCLCHRSWGGIAHRPLSGGRCRHGGRAKSKKPRRNQESGESGHRERGQHGRSPPCLIHRRPCALDLAACICRRALRGQPGRSEEHTSELQSRLHLVCRLLLEKKKTDIYVCHDHTVWNQTLHQAIAYQSDGIVLFASPSSLVQVALESTKAYRGCATCTVSAHL